MKRVWKAAELTRHFNLVPADFLLIGNKTGPTRFGFTVMLKFFQYTGRFPTHKNEVPRPVLLHLAEQLEMSLELYLAYEWQGHSWSRHRVQIREAFGFREIRAEDATALVSWLTEQVLPQEFELAQLMARCYEYLHQLKLEPPSPARLERLVRSARRKYELELAEQIEQHLSETCRERLDQLLKLAGTNQASAVVSVETASDPERLDKLLWHELKAEPGRPSLESIEREIAKLTRLQQLALPSDLFSTLSLSHRLVHHLRLRAATEQLYELKCM